VVRAAFFLIVMLGEPRWDLFLNDKDTSVIGSSNVKGDITAR
jgi:hypothetical protein